MAIATDARLVPECLPHRLAQRDPDIFCGVVIVDVEVSLGMDFQIPEAMASQQDEHMVEETNTGSDVVAAIPIDVQYQANPGLASFAFDTGASLRPFHPTHRIDSNRSMHASLCASVPTEIRRPAPHSG